MIKYYNEIKTREGYILSIDKVRLVFKFKSERDSLVFRLNMLNNTKTEKGKNISVLFAEKMYYAQSDTKDDYEISDEDFYKARPDFCVEEYTHNSAKFGTYKYMYNLHPAECIKETITIAHCLNNSKDTRLEGFIEFNPNKCFCEALNWILKTLRLHCSYLILKRYDLALDIFCRADYITLHKDERKYELCRPSNSDLSRDTEYLGQRNETGRFKKYNKKIEHNLRASADEQINEEITRLELTLNTFEFTEVCRLFPKIEKISDNTDLTNHISYLEEFEKLTATDKVLVKLLQESDNKDNYFSELGRDKKNKLRKFLYEHFHEEIVIHEDDFNKCISKMKDYLQLFNTNAPTKLIR